MTWQLPLLIWCTNWSYFDSEKKGQKTPEHLLYCYDNIFADLALQSGKPGLRNINAYFDTFTWEGYMELIAINVGINFVYEFIWNTLLGIVGASIFAAMSDIPLCVAGEQELMIAFGDVAFDLCTLIEW